MDVADYIVDVMFGASSEGWLGCLNQFLETLTQKGVYELQLLYICGNCNKSLFTQSWFKFQIQASLLSFFNLDAFLTLVCANFLFPHNHDTPRTKQTKKNKSTHFLGEND